MKKYTIEKYGAIDEWKGFKNPRTGNTMPFDIYIPDYKIFIEVMGEQHFRTSERWHEYPEELEEIKKRDRIKKKYAKKNGYYIMVDLRKRRTNEFWRDYIEKEISKVISKEKN